MEDKKTYFKSDTIYYDNDIKIIANDVTSFGKRVEIVGNRCTSHGQNTYHKGDYNVVLGLDPIIEGNNNIYMHEPERCKGKDNNKIASRFIDPNMPKWQKNNEQEDQVLRNLQDSYKRRDVVPLRPQGVLINAECPDYGAHIIDRYNIITNNSNVSNSSDISNDNNSNNRNQTESNDEKVPELKKIVYFSSEFIFTIEGHIITSENKREEIWIIFDELGGTVTIERKQSFLYRPVKVKNMLTGAAELVIDKYTGHIAIPEQYNRLLKREIIEQEAIYPDHRFNNIYHESEAYYEPEINDELEVIDNLPKEPEPKNKRNTKLTSKFNEKNDKKAEEGSDQCVICLDNEPRVAFDDCGHFNTCISCSIKLEEENIQKKTKWICHICKSPIIKVIPIYK